MNTYSTTAQDLESYILAFNPDTLLSRELFASRHKMDLVVLVDNGSHKQGSPSPLGKLLDILKSDKSLKQPPVLVQGGFTAWKDFVMSRNASSSSSWIGHGFRRTPSLNRPSKDSKDIPPADYARTSYEYVCIFTGFKIRVAIFTKKKYRSIIG